MQVHIFMSVPKSMGRCKHLVLVDESFVLGGCEVAQHDGHAAHTEGRAFHLFHQCQVLLQ